MSDCSRCQASPHPATCTDPACPIHAARPARASARARVLVLGNEKGGSGKSTTAMHLIVALLKGGFRVGSIDLDARQGSLSRMLENRAAYGAAVDRPSDQVRGLALPEHRRVARAEAPSRAEAQAAERAALDAALGELLGLDFVVVDTPGSDSFLSRLGHASADVLITPLNDSYLDLDLLARIDVQGRRVLGPSLYSQMVWEQRQQRALAGLAPMEWVVMRNRLSHIDARNKRDIGRLLELLGARIGFRLAPGFGERVIFRELFPRGLTLLDLPDEAQGGVALTMSHVAARQELRALLQAIDLPAGNGARAGRAMAAGVSGGPESL